MRTIASLQLAVIPAKAGGAFQRRLPVIQCLVPRRPPVTGICACGHGALPAKDESPPGRRAFDDACRVADLLHRDRVIAAIGIRQVVLRIEHDRSHRLGALDFKVRRLDDAVVEGRPARRYRLGLASWIGFALPHIDVAYDARTRELLRFVGLANIRGSNGDNVRARIVFRITSYNVCYTKLLRTLTWHFAMKHTRGYHCAISKMSPCLLAFQSVRPPNSPGTV